jgi:hypothetical protein
MVDTNLNVSALIAVGIFAAALLSIFGAVYYDASKSRARGELDPEGIRILRWALAGHLTLFLLLGITAFLT